VSQFFSPSGLTFIFNQLNIGDTPATPNYKVGLFTSTLQELIDAGGMIYELDAPGYSRIVTTFGSPTFSTANALDGTTLAQSSQAGDWFITVNTSTITQVGMTVLLDGEEPLVITGLPDGPYGEIRFVLSAPIANAHNSGEAVGGGDAVNGVKSIGSPVLFSALATWPAVTGYFVVADSMETSPINYIYASTFADATTPILGPNDTLQVTPTWLMSSY
jgi:hypothetical protein